MRGGPATVVVLVLAAVLLSVWREGGTYAIRSWIRAKTMNDPLPRPTRGARR